MPTNRDAEFATHISNLPDNSVAKAGVVFRTHVIFVMTITLFAALFTLPMLVNGFWPFAWDSPLHEAWYYHFSQQFWSGEFYPRWLAGMNQGLGSPVLFYYPPLPYWITSIMQPLIPNDPAGWRALGVSTSVALACSGISCFYWLRSLTNNRSACIAAILFMLMPYHLRTDLYLNAMFAEFWSYAWMPLVLLCIRRIPDNGGFASLGLAVSYAALVMTHLPTTLLFSPIAICYAAFRAHLLKDWKFALQVSAGMALGVGIASIYLIPAMMMQQHCNMKQLLVFGYANSFFFANSSLWDDEFQHLMLASILTTFIVGLCGTAAAIRSKSNERTSEIYFWAAVMAFTVFMMFPVSNFVWKLIPTLQTVQFPWRYGTVLSVAACLPLALGISSLQGWRTSTSFTIFMIACGSIAGWVCITMIPVWNTHILGIVRFNQAPELFPSSLIRSASSAQPSTLDAPEYVPSGVRTNRSTAIEKFARKTFDLSMVTNGVAEAKMLTARHIQVNVNASQGCTVQLRQFYYAGWSAFIDGNMIATKPSEPYGLIQFDVPPGQHHVQVILLRGREELIGLSITIAAALLASTYAIWLLRTRLKKTSLMTERLIVEA